MPSCLITLLVQLGCLAACGVTVYAIFLANYIMAGTAGTIALLLYLDYRVRLEREKLHKRSPRAYVYTPDPADYVPYSRPKPKPKTVKPPTDFVAVDFETANKNRVSACQIGLVHIRDGKVISTYCHLIKPVGGHTKRISKIHRITEADTANAPSFAELYREVKPLLNNQTIVSYTPFDKQVLKALIEYYQLPLAFKHFDACKFAREKLPGLDNYRLTTVAEKLGLAPFEHHDAAADAQACAAVYLALRML